LTRAQWEKTLPAGWLTSELHGGTVTFLFTDIEGSTRLLQELGGGYEELLAEHQRILRAAFAAHGGQEVDTQGDSFFVAFRTAKDAVAAAVDGQRDLAAQPWPAGAQIRVRTGLHTGEPKVGRDRYVGIGVHRAARIGDAGHGGQVLLSSTTKELAEEDLPAGVAIRDLGERRLKDIEQPQRLYQLVIEGLPSEFKPLRTLDVELKRKRRRLHAGAALIGAAAAAVAVPIFALGQGSSGAAGVEVMPNSVAVIDPKLKRVTDDLAVGARPAEIVAGFGSVWVLNRDDGTVSRIDPRTRRVVRLIPVNVEPTGLAAGAGSIWFESAGRNSFVGGNTVAKIRLGRIDPAFNSVAATVELKNPAEYTYTGPLAAGGGAVWVTGGGNVIRVDPASARETLARAPTWRGTPHRSWPWQTSSTETSSRPGWGRGARSDSEWATWTSRRSASDGRRRASAGLSIWPKERLPLSERYQDPEGALTKGTRKKRAGTCPPEGSVRVSACGGRPGPRLPWPLRFVGS
jgi:YVTN family beta-propeller protein